MDHQSLPPSLQDELAEITFRESAPERRAQRLVELIARHPEHEAALRAATAPRLHRERVGPFEILGVLGEGGFGRVYRARQMEDVDRIVALKVLRNDLDSRAVLARFELERQVLAAMNHAAIARFFEAGQAEDQLWFSMELVEGQPLTAYCDDHELTIPDRLRLLLQVCDGVQHAHGKGIVHRDLKPANVLVDRVDSQHSVKIIDFGIARATGRQLTPSLQTMVGMVLGTPEYMAPEQCGGDPIHIDARTDVYALGVMLYELLSGQLPFSSNELPRDDLLKVQRVLLQKDPPKPSTRIGTLGADGEALARKRHLSSSTWRRAVRGDLDDIVARAMEKEPNRRYQSVADFAADLRRHLGHEPIVARPPSRVYRLKKFVSRYRGQVLAGAAVVITAISGAVVAVFYAVEASANETVANQRAADNLKLAREKGSLATSLDGKVREFDQLAGVVLYERAIANEQELYPAWPHKIEAMERWLRDDCGKLLAMRPGIERTVRELESRALPLTAEEAAADRRTHPRFAEYDTAAKHLASLRYAQAIRDGTNKLVEPMLTAQQQALDANALNTLAWSRVAPKAGERAVDGEAAVGLAAARVAVAKAKATPLEFQALDTLAWALLANGQDAAAKEASAHALDLAPEDRAPEHEDRARALDTAITDAANDLRMAEKQVAALAASLSERQTFRFELESQRFLHDTLVDLLGKLASLSVQQKAVEQRLSWARQIEQLTLAHPNARHTWAAVRAAVAANPKYAGQSIPLRDEDVLGLVPIGENPVTHMWEFYELRSAWDGSADRRAIAIPQHEPDGSIKVTGATGIVFVLLPGGTFTMGAQKEDENRPNYDPYVLPEEVPHSVTLAPFFLGRHELTQGQWSRLWTWDASLRTPSTYKAGTSVAGKAITLANPVERVDWLTCDKLLRRYGLVLPTEAQWEYGCRGGTTTTWVVTKERLKTVANIAGAEARGFSSLPCESWEDGDVVHAPVGSYAANAFGLYDVHGNVWEWCRDGYGAYGGERVGDGLRSLAGPVDRVIRGGGFTGPATHARSAFRFRFAPSVLANNQGLRPAKLIEP